MTQTLLDTKKLSIYLASTSALLASGSVAASIVYTDLSGSPLTSFDDNIDDSLQHYITLDFSNLNSVVLGQGDADRGSVATPLNGLIGWSGNDRDKGQSTKTDGGQFVGNGVSIIDNIAGGDSISSANGSWGNTIEPLTNANGVFLGLKIEQGSDFNYGWLRYNNTSGFENNSLSVTGFAIETTSNQSINAGEVPEPDSLALLLAGASGLALLRRRRVH